MERFQDWARDIVSGVPTGATVAVFETGTQTPAQLFEDDASPTPQDNPFQTDPTTGIFAFYAVNGRYDVTITPTDDDLDAYSLSDVLLFDPDDE